MENINGTRVFYDTESVNLHKVHDNLSHWHKGIELIYVNKGSMYCKTNDDLFKLQKGDICFINNNQIHSLSCDGKIDCQHDTLIIDLSLFDTNKELFDEYIKPIIEDKSFAHIRFNGMDSHAAKIYQCMKQIDELKKEKPLAYELGVISKTYEIMMNIFAVYKDNNYIKTKPNYNTVLLQEMLEYIHENYAYEISLNDIADVAGISISKCNQLFKKYTDSSPISFLNNYRIEKSAELLRNTDYPIARIALESGFNDQSYFDRVFLKEYGMTPLKYRNII